MAVAQRSMAGRIWYGLPPAIRWIMAICLVTWILQLATWKLWSGLWLRLALVAELFVGQLHLWQPITYQFLHEPVSPLHLIFNMWSLWLFGRELERRWGSFPFLRFYLACGIGAGLVHVALSLAFGIQRGIVMGASGAVMGVMVAFAVIWPHRKIYILPLPVAIEVRWLVLVFIVLDLLAAWRDELGVANLAHLGGALTGYLYMRFAGRIGGGLGLPWPPRWLVDWRLRRRRRGMRIAEKDWDAWMRDVEDDHRRH